MVTLRRVSCALFAALLVVAVLPGMAWAHAILVHASIQPGSLIRSMPPVLTVQFSESIRPSLSSLHVLGPYGTSASYGPPASGASPRTLAVHLRLDGGGTYTVTWAAVSAEDGQVTSGAFRFAVGYVSQAADLQTPVVIHAGGVLRVTEGLGVATEWLVLLAALLWAGGALFEAPPGIALARAATSGTDSWLALVSSRSVRSRARLLEIMLGLLIFAWVVQAVRFALVGRVSLLGGIAALFLGGQLGALHLLLLILPLIAFLDVRRPNTPPQVTGRARYFQPGAALRRLSAMRSRLPAAGGWGQCCLAALFLLAVAASGHAAGIAGITLSAVLLTWLHMMAAASWLGVLAYLVVIVLPEAEDLDLDRRAPLMLGLLRRLLPFTVVSMATLAISGLFASQELVGSAAAVVTTRFGLVLTAKSLLVAVALALTLYLLLPLRRRLEGLWAQRQRLESLHTLNQLGGLLRLGALLGMLITAATAVLATSAPPALGALPALGSPPAPVSSAVWQPVGLQGKAVYRLLFDPSNRHILWAATDQGVWRSTDDQQTWQERGAALAHLTVRDLLILDGGHELLAAASNGQLYRTTDAGKHWQHLRRPFGNQPLRAVARHGTVLLAAGADGIFRSIDGGRHWQAVLKLRPPGVGALSWSPAGKMFLAGLQGGPWQLYGADGAGLSWHLLPEAPGVPSGVTSLSQSSGSVPRVFVGTIGAGLWAAPTPESPWRAVRAGLSATQHVTALLPDTRTLGRFYLGALDSGVYASQDGGTSWSPLGRSAPSRVLSLAMRPGPIRILYAGTIGGIYKLTIGA
jgi:methionine-rich copper-binding protein CopC/putative copper export protein/photosystem II stability/assembly factor-like uncharacterized protein